MALGTDQLGPAGQAPVEALGVGAIADPQRHRAVLGDARDREMGRGALHVALGERAGPVLDHLDGLRIGPAGDPFLDRQGGRVVTAAGGEGERERCRR